MPSVQTNQVNLAAARESATIGTLPGSPIWRNLEPNDIGRFGRQNTSVQREPISGDRMARAGTLTDIDAGVEFEEDWTYSAFLSLAEAFVLADFTGPAAFDVANDALAVASTTAYSVTAGGALAEDTLVYARGFTNAANNGLKVVDTGATATSIPIKGGGLVVETPGATSGALLEVAGVRGITDDLEIDANGDLISTDATTPLDFTTLSLNVGQIIHIGGVETANRFGTAADFGPARIVSIAAQKIVLENRSDTYVADTGAGKQIDILFGRFLRPVTADHADYNQISHAFELHMPTLGAASTSRYIYTRGAVCNTIGFQVPLSDKCGLSWAFAATTADNPTGTRETNGADATTPSATEALSSSIDVGRLRFHDFDSGGFGSCFKSLDVQINNNVTPDKCIATLGAKGVNIGSLGVQMNAEVVFTDEDVITALNDNVDVAVDFVVRNDDGGVAVDLPAMKLGGGNFNFPRNETVRIQLEGRAFKHVTLGYPCSFSTFPVIPRE